MPAEPSRLKHRLSHVDAAFVNFERDAMPMNLGSLGIYEGVVPFDEFVPHITRRIALVPRYHQRVRRVPFEVAYPAWVDDPEFDPARHVRLLDLPPPGTDEQLLEAAGDFFGERLSPDRPLWEMVLVHGLAGGRSAHLAKMHHSMVDGISGVELLAALLDSEPEHRDRELLPLQQRAKRSSGLFADALLDRARDALRMQEEMWRAALRPEATMQRVERVTQALEKALPYAMEPAPPTPWNGPLRRPRRLAGASFAFERMHDVALRLGGTVNDAVLTLVAGALGRYLAAQGALGDGRPLRVATPVNVRHSDEASTLGNRVSVMVASLPVAEPDPVRRFASIHKEMRSLKDVQQANGVDCLFRVFGDLPPALLRLFGRTLSAPNTIANLTCTNVAGPPVPMYLIGHKLIEHWPWVPLVWRMGLSVAAMSYDGRMYISVCADERMTQHDVGAIAAYLREEFDLLCARTTPLSSASRISHLVSDAEQTNTAGVSAAR